MNVQPFNAQAKTLQIAVSNSASTSKALPALGSVIRIVSEPGGSTAYISVGTGTQIATTPSTVTPTATSTPILSGEDLTLCISSDAIQNISAITASGSATLNVQVGEGL